MDRFAELDCYANQIPISVLRDWLESAQLTYTDVEAYTRFNASRYVRNLMHAGPAYQALVLCWRQGQRSPIHDHIGSNCAVQVLKGEAWETIFQHAPNGMIYPTSSRVLRRQSITASADSDIHQVSNLQANRRNLVTLHLYSPPLLSMNTYSLLDGSVTEFVDPINEEFTEGLGI